MHVFGKLWFIDSKQITEQIMRPTRLSTCSKLTRRVLERSLAFVESERYANGVERENQQNVLYVRITIYNTLVGLTSDNAFSFSA